MECDICSKEAKVHLTQFVGGQIKKIHLCEDCAKEKGVTDPTGFGFAEMLLSQGIPTKGQAAGPPSVGLSTSAKRCPDCGFTLEDFRRIRRFGCATCYTTFRDELTSALGGMHKGVHHHGKVPTGLMAQQRITERLEELRTRLEAAVSSENYEEAAGIRDEIRRLEAPLQSAKSD
jgi:protein arginine kinase activator